MSQPEHILSRFGQMESPLKLPDGRSNIQKFLPCAKSTRMLPPVPSIIILTGCKVSLLPSKALRPHSETCTSLSCASVQGRQSSSSSSETQHTEPRQLEGSLGSSLLLYYDQRNIRSSIKRTVMEYTRRKRAKYLAFTSFIWPFLSAILLFPCLPCGALYVPQQSKISERNSPA